MLVSEGIPMNVEEIQVRQSLSDGDDTSGTLRNVYLTIRDLIVSAQRANVNIYPIDPAGLWAGADSYKQDFLRALATNTGGFPIVDTNDPRPEIDRIFRENSSYYLVGYVSPNPRHEGRFRKVEVKVRDESLTVRARTGYLEPIAATTSKKPATKPLPLMTALASLVPKGDVAMQMAAAPFAVAGTKKAAVAIVVGLRQPAPPGNERVVENVTLRVDAYNPKGGQKGPESHRAPGAQAGPLTDRGLRAARPPRPPARALPTAGCGPERPRRQGRQHLLRPRRPRFHQGEGVAVGRRRQRWRRPGGRAEERPGGAAAAFPTTRASSGATRR